MMRCCTVTFRGCPMLANSVSSVQKLHIIGAGCAGLSLAARADELPNHEISITPPHASDADHLWGFWQAPDLADAAGLCRHHWPHWEIVTRSGTARLESAERPYMALQRSRWIESCQDRAEAAGIVLREEADDASQILDSRPPAMPKNVMIQHFIGWEIQAPAGSFDSGCARLMDFRCDQSRGVHFIYLLPFSDREALVESTMFSPQLEPDAFYTAAIEQYLSAICGIDQYRVERREQGAIPMAEITPRDPSLTPIGANGGAIRPSSGYAFVFIQRQIARAIADGKDTAQPLRFEVPHKKIDLLMDRVFLTVLRRWPSLAPRLFLRMGQALTGDEFAQFMAGEADMRLRLKVIMAMPKWPFLRALFPALFGGGAASGGTHDSGRNQTQEGAGDPA